MKILSRSIKLFVFLLVVSVAAYSYLFWLNNRADELLSDQEISDRFETSIQWLVTNEQNILKQNNPMLWWMIDQSATLTRDARLVELFNQYKSRYLTSQPNNIWNALFNPNYFPILPADIESRLPDYNVHFFYGLTCQSGLGNLSIVQQQNQANFCGKNHPISPACYTHQLMAVRFMLERGCGDPDENIQLARFLENKIRLQLTWDPRVVDVYLQRVLMGLQRPDSRSLVKPVWINRAARAQQPDGGWSAFQPIVNLGFSHLGFSSRLIGFGHPKSNFHATAQGIYILSILAGQQQQIPASES